MRSRSSPVIRPALAHVRAAFLSDVSSVRILPLGCLSAGRGTPFEDFARPEHHHGSTHTFRGQVGHQIDFLT